MASAVDQQHQSPSPSVCQKQASTASVQCKDSSKSHQTLQPPPPPPALQVHQLGLSQCIPEHSTLKQNTQDLSCLAECRQCRLLTLGPCQCLFTLILLQEFLPPLESINLPPLNEFLKSVGLPNWEEMNLPPLSEFMKPVFDPEAVQLPNLQVCQVLGFMVLATGGV